MNELQDLLLNVVLGFLTILCTYALAWIKNSINQIKVNVQATKDKELRQLAIEAINRIDKLSEDTVMALESVIAKQLREKVKAGQAPRSALLEIGKEAFLSVKNKLGDQYIDALNDTMDDVDSYIKDVIEAKLEMYKTVGINASK